jgi:pyruvate carboxylase
LVGDASIRALQTKRLSGNVHTVDICDLVTAMTRLVPEMAVIDVASQQTVGGCLGAARECPFRRIEEIRRAAPGLVFRATLSAATCFGPKVAPRSALPVTADELVKAGVEIIRVIDPFNDLDRLVAAVTAASLAEAVVEGAVCLDGSLHPALSGHVSATVAVASSLERHGANVIVIEDRNGALRPTSAYSLVRAVRREVNLPVWIRVVDAGGFGLATLLSAVEAGAVGVDTVMPSFAGPGFEPDSVSLTNALYDTERRPEMELISLIAVDDLLRDQVLRLGGWRPMDRPLPDASDRGASPGVMAAVLHRVSDAHLVSDEQALAACEAAWRALGQPAAVSPARQAMVELATRMIETGEAAGPLLDRARVDDPQGLLDSVSSLREGGFPEGTIAEVAPQGKTELLRSLLSQEADLYDQYLARFGEIEMIPGEVSLHGLGVGEICKLLEEGEPRTIEVRSIDLERGRAQVRLDDQEIEVELATTEG